MNWRIRFWQIKKWILLNLILSHYWKLNGLTPNYSSDFRKALGDYSEMKINGKLISIHIIGITILGVGMLHWIVQSKRVHHVIIVCNNQGLCQFEKNVLSQCISHSIVEGNLPPHIMAEKVKELIDR